MSAYFGFSENRDLRLPDWPSEMRSGILAILLGVILLYVSLFIFLPSDLYSTAVWYDSLNVRNAISGQVSHFDSINLNRVSAEGFWFSVFITIFNLSLAYQAAFGGHWLEGDKSSNLFTVVKYAVSPKGAAKRVNTIKLGYLVMLIGITVFETWTGMEFRQQDQGIVGAIRAAGVAFVVENAGSDWGLTLSIAMGIGGFFQIWNAYSEGSDDIKRIRGMISGVRPTQQEQKKPHPNNPGRPDAQQKHGKQNGDKRGHPDRGGPRVPHMPPHLNRPTPNGSPAMSDAEIQEILDVMNGN